MAKVHVCNVLVLDNPAAFTAKLEFEITFECIEDLPEDLEWKIIYVGSAESEEFDQVLDTVYVGPVPEGRHKFVFTADPPNPAKIPVTDVVGVTVILLTCSYRSQEFIRVGYYVSNEYQDPELQENPPEQPIFEKLTRNILASNPRVTKFKINWDDQANGQSTSNGATNGEEEGMQSGEVDENCPPPPPANPYLPESMRRPNPLPLQKDPNLESPMKGGGGLRMKEDSNSCSQSDMDFD